MGRLGVPGVLLGLGLLRLVRLLRLRLQYAPYASSVPHTERYTLANTPAQYRTEMEEYASSVPHTQQKLTPDCGFRFDTIYLSPSGDSTRRELSSTDIPRCTAIETR
eukprot:3117391-Rhodomonas_salina.1